jgi:hypothetical protein
MPHPLIEALVGIQARGESVGKDCFKCDYEGCPGRKASAKKRLFWHPKYLFVHRQCVPVARRAARERGEMFGFRMGL